MVLTCTLANGLGMKTKKFAWCPHISAPNQGCDIPGAIFNEIFSPVLTNWQQQLTPSHSNLLSSLLTLSYAQIRQENRRFSKPFRKIFRNTTSHITSQTKVNQRARSDASWVKLPQRVYQLLEPIKQRMRTSCINRSPPPSCEPILYAKELTFLYLFICSAAFRNGKYHLLLFIKWTDISQCIWLSDLAFLGLYCAKFG